MQLCGIRKQTTPPPPQFQCCYIDRKIYWRCHTRQFPLPLKLLATQTTLKRGKGDMLCVLTNRSNNYVIDCSSSFINGQFQCLAKFLLKHEKQNPSLQLKRSYQK